MSRCFLGMVDGLGAALCLIPILSGAHPMVAGMFAVVAVLLALSAVELLE